MCFTVIFTPDDEPPCPFVLSFHLPPWRVVRSYRPHLNERDPIWDNDWSDSPFIRRSPNSGFPRFSSAVRQMRKSVHSPRDYFIITLIINDRRDWRDTQGTWPLAIVILVGIYYIIFYIHVTRIMFLRFSTISNLKLNRGSKILNYSNFSHILRNL